MATIDIRKEDTAERIDEIKFSDDESIRLEIITKPGFSKIWFTEDGDSEFYIMSDQAENLIKALQQAKALGWF